MLPPEKMFFTIGEVSKLLNVSTTTIRFWEKEFDIIQPDKNRKGNRLFKPEDVKNLRTIHHLVKERGFTLQGAKQKLLQNQSDTINKTEIVATLKKFKEFLQDLKNEIL
jgi:DNA-binding transcriptional MerR regulator